MMKRVKLEKDSLPWTYAKSLFEAMPYLEMAEEELNTTGFAGAELLLEEKKRSFLRTAMWDSVLELSKGFLDSLDMKMVEEPEIFRGVVRNEWVIYLQTSKGFLAVHNENDSYFFKKVGSLEGSIVEQIKKGFILEEVSAPEQDDPNK